MYLPTEEEAQRKAITSSFQDYCRNTTAPLLNKYKGKTHWAKLEKPRSAEEVPVRHMLLHDYMLLAGALISGARLRAVAALTAAYMPLVH